MSEVGWVCGAYVCIVRSLWWGALIEGCVGECAWLVFESVCITSCVHVYMQVVGCV